MRRFCVVSTGRSGSQAFGKALAQHADIFLPPSSGSEMKLELLNPNFIAGHRDHFAPGAAGIRGVIDGFWKAGAGHAYAGFKLLPWQHPRFRDFVQREGVQFITLVRRDVAATVASFYLAETHGSWRKASTEVGVRWTFGEADRPMVQRLVQHVRINLAQMALIRDPIILHYEDLCRADFSHPALDAFFGRRIALPSPRAPSDPAQYVMNWPQLRAHIEQLWDARYSIVKPNLADAGTAP